MTIGLLITTFILIFIVTYLPILIIYLNLKNIKEKEEYKKTLTVVSIINFLIFISIVCLWITPIKNKELTITKNEKQEVVTLTNAGFNEVDINEYLSLVNGSEKSIILIARPTCSYCEKFTPILKEAMEDLNIKVNYIDTDKLTDETWQTFSSSVSYLTENEWGTPLLLIVQNGEVIADNQGYVELDTIKEFFINNGFGK